MGDGRPTKYKPEYDEMARKLCLLGYIDRELADFFNVTEQTINNWKVEHSTFFESLKSGKEIADAEVAQSLYKRATGFKIKKVKFATNEGEITDKEEYEEEVAPDTGAAMAWLKNRQPKKWRDKQIIEHEGGMNINQRVANMTDEEKEKRRQELKSKLGD